MQQSIGLAVSACRSRRGHFPLVFFRLLRGITYYHTTTTMSKWLVLLAVCAIAIPCALAASKVRSQFFIAQGYAVDE